MDRRAAVLSGAGLCLLGPAAISGGLATGYGMGPFAMLLRIGVLWLTLGVLTGIADPSTVRQGVKHAATAVLIVFVVGSGLMYYDLAVTQPEHGTPLTPSLVVATQLQLVSITLPIPAGYLAGILVRDDEPIGAAVTLLAVLVVSPIVGIQIAVAEGFASGFAGAFFITATVLVSAFALPPLLLMGWIDPETRNAEPVPSSAD